MKHLIALVSLASAFALSTPAMANEGSSCHFHGNKPAAEATVLGCASAYKDSLVKTGKIDSSWQAVKQDKVEMTDGKKAKEWKVTFKNPAVTDKSKETLYLFFTPPGNFIAANFTGQ
jgi:hypothetical protein